MNPVGKTIARVEERPTHPAYGDRRDDTILIHFTDGTALEVTGSSYEEVYLGSTMLDRDNAIAWRRAAAGRRERDRIERLKREEWLAASCEERAKRRGARRAGMERFAKAIEEMTERTLDDMVLSANTFGYGFGVQPERRVKQRCVRCGERECENARVKVIPAHGGMHSRRRLGARHELAWGQRAEEVGRRRCILECTLLLSGKRKMMTGSKISLVEGDRISFWCPGCDHAHTVRIGEGGWWWNGSMDLPTITPSVLVKGVQWEEGSAFHKPLHKIPRGANTVCHSFVTDGRIQFLGDCTHSIAEQTVGLPAWGSAQN